MNHQPVDATPRSAAPPPHAAESPTPYDVILADPPWPRQSGENHYDTMSLEQITGMGPAIQNLSAEHAHLYLWTTNALLEETYDVIRAWGFRKRSVLTWVKMYRLGLGGPYGLRNATEHVLFATRGKAPVQFRSQPTWFVAPVAQHSVKPDELYAIIDRLSGKHTRKLEIFGRRKPPAPNWHVWGDQIPSDVVIPGYPVPHYSDAIHRDGEVDRS